ATQYYPVVISDPEDAAKFGTYRMSMYTDDSPANTNCTDAFIVKNYPYENFMYVSKAASSVITMNGEDHSKAGGYYRVTAPSDGDLIVLVDDLSEVSATLVLFREPICVVIEEVNRPQGAVGIYDHTTDPYGQRGTHFRLNAIEKGEELLIFVGADSTAKGIVHVKMTFIKDETPLIVPSGFLLSKIFWVIFGYILIGLAILTALLLGILYWFNNRKKVNYGHI
ncbi:hypothetical protein EIN_132340, partial [Entamoeba invadens IP1]